MGAARFVSSHDFLVRFDFVVLAIMGSYAGFGWFVASVASWSDLRPDLENTYIARWPEVIRISAI